jgi:ribonuclease HI
MEIEATIQKVPPGRAPGEDGINPGILKMAFKSIPEVFLALYNRCLELAYFPCRWRCIQTVIIKKPRRDPNMVSSYRPLSMLPVMGKLLESIISARLLIFMESLSLFHADQWGFRPAVGTDHCLSRLMWALDKYWSLTTSAVFVQMDLTGAFDNLTRGSIMESLAANSVPDYITSFYSSFLEDGSATLTSWGVSTSRRTTRGVAQGSHSAPLLFLIAYDLIVRRALAEAPLEEGVILTYADDGSLVVSQPNDDLNFKGQRTLNSLTRLCSLAGMEMNPQKCSFMIPIRRSRDMLAGLEVRVAGHQLTRTTEQALLGVLIDEKLTFLPHIAQKHNEIVRMIFNIKKRGLNRGRELEGRFGITLHKLVFTSKILHGSVAWVHRTWEYATSNPIFQRLFSLESYIFRHLIMPRYGKSGREAVLACIGVKTFYREAQQRAMNFRQRIPLMERDRFHKLRMMPIHIGLPYEDPLEDLTESRLPFVDNSQRRFLQLDLRGGPMSERDSDPGFKYIIFTDGSRTEDRHVGAGLIVFTDGIPTATRRIQLADGNSAGQAEKVAILAALELAETELTGGRVKIVSDSRAALLSLIKCNDLTSLDLQMTLKANRLGDRVTFAWTKAHVGTEGNERADEQARLAGLSVVGTETNRQPAPMSTWKFNLDKKFMDLAQQNWESSEAARRLFGAAPLLATLRQLGSLAYSPMVFAFLTGFGPFRRHLHILQRSSTESCVCSDDSVQDPFHVLFECPITGRLLRRLRAAVVQHPLVASLDAIEIVHSGQNSYMAALVDIISVRSRPARRSPASEAQKQKLTLKGDSLKAMHRIYRTLPLMTLLQQNASNRR